jgi:LCCL domain
MVRKSCMWSILAGSALLVGSCLGQDNAQATPEIAPSIPAVEKIVSEFDSQAAAIREEVKTTQKAAKDDALKQLQELQDRLVRDAKLDEAIAVRQRIRSIAGLQVAAPQAAANPRSIFPKVPRLPNRNVTTAQPVPLNEEGTQIVDAYKIKSHDIEEMGREKIRLLGEEAAKPLQAIFEMYCKEAKLDEAVATRSAIQKVALAFITPLPDPGILHFEPYEVGRVLYYETVGTVVGNVRGTDIYTSDSLLAATAVHAGVLSPGEKGIVKVTVLPGELEYFGSDRNGVSSIESGELPVSFRVDKVSAGTENPKADAVLPTNQPEPATAPNGL